MRFLGPVLQYDMIRTARRGRFLLVRALYALLLGVMFYLAYMAAFHWGHRSHTGVSPKDLTNFTEEFFSKFMATQYVLALLLTPAYVAGAIAEEKERRTLEFMLTTDLYVSEILLSKLVSRLANVTLFVLTGLPILSLIQLFGGINPLWLWFGFAGTGLTVLSVGSLSIWVSVHSRKPRAAILGTYMIVAAYFLVWAMLLAGYGMIFDFRNYNAVSVSGKVYAWMVEVYQTGNPVYGRMRLEGNSILPGLNPRMTTLELARNFTIFHLVIALVCILHAMRRLRPVYMHQTYATVKKGKTRFARKRRPVYVPAMMWKELHGDAPRSSLGSKLMFALTVLACCVPLCIILYLASRVGFSWREWQMAMNMYVRIVGSIIAMLTLLIVAIRAATSVGSEHDRETMVSLLSTPLTDREILLAKWWGSIRGTLPLYLLVFCIWGLGLITGGVNLFAVPFMLGILICYTMFAASFGLMFGAGAKTTTRALIWTIGCMVVWGGAHWFITGFLLIPFMFIRFEWPAYLLAGFTPPFVVGWATFSWEMPFNVESRYGGGQKEIAGLWFGALIGVGTNLGLAFALWGMALARFRRTSGRVWPPRWAEKKERTFRSDDA